MLKLSTIYISHINLSTKLYLFHITVWYVGLIPIRDHEPFSSPIDYADLVYLLKENTRLVYNHSYYLYYQSTHSDYIMKENSGVNRLHYVRKYSPMFTYHLGWLSFIIIYCTRIIPKGESSPRISRIRTVLKTTLYFASRYRHVNAITFSNVAVAFWLV